MIEASRRQKRESQGSGVVYLISRGAFEIYSMWSLAVKADIKIITTVC